MQKQQQSTPGYTLVHMGQRSPTHTGISEEKRTTITDASNDSHSSIATCELAQPGNTQTPCQISATICQQTMKFFEQTHRTKRSLGSYNKFIKLQLFIIVFVDVSATAAAFIGTTIHQVQLQQTVSSHRSVEVSRTPWSRFIDLSRSFLMCITSLIHRSILLLSLSITLVWSQSMTWLREVTSR